MSLWPRQKPLQIRMLLSCRVAGVLGDGPAVLPWQVSEQAEQETAGPAAGPDTGEPAGHPIEEPVGLGGPALRFYAVTHGTA